MPFFCCIVLPLHPRGLGERSPHFRPFFSFLSTAIKLRMSRGTDNYESVKSRRQSESGGGGLFLLTKGWHSKEEEGWAREKQSGRVSRSGMKKQDQGMCIAMRDRGVTSCS